MNSPTIHSDASHPHPQSRKLKGKRLLHQAVLEALEPRRLFSTTTYPDRINFGDTTADATSESVHSFDSGDTTLPPTGTGAESLTYREIEGPAVVGTTGTGANNEALTFTMAVSSTQQNYLTIKLWGSDTTNGIIYLYNPTLGYSIDNYDYTSTPELDIQDTTNEPFPGRFYYETTPIPLSWTTGLTSVSLTLQGAYQDQRYNNNTTIQLAADQVTKPIYSAFTSTNPYFTPATTDVAGTAPTQTTKTLSTLTETQAINLLEANREAIYTTGNYFNNLLGFQITTANAPSAPPEVIGLDLGTNVATWLANFVKTNGVQPTPDQWRDQVALQEPQPGYSNVPDELLSALYSTYLLKPFTDANGNVVSGLDHYHSSSVLSDIVSAMDGSTYLQGSDGGFSGGFGAFDWPGLTSTPRATPQTNDDGTIPAGATGRYPSPGFLGGEDIQALGQTIINLLDDPSMPGSGGVTNPANFIDFLGGSLNANLTGAPMVRAYAYERMLFNAINSIRGDSGGTVSQNQFDIMGLYACQIALEKLQALFPNVSHPALPASLGLYYAQMTTGTAPTTLLGTAGRSDYSLTASGFGQEPGGTDNAGYDGEYGEFVPQLATDITQLATEDPGLNNPAGKAAIAQMEIQARNSIAGWDQFLGTNDSISGTTDTATLTPDDVISIRKVANPDELTQTFNSQYLASDPTQGISSPYALRSAYLETQYGVTPVTSVGLTSSSLDFLRLLPNYEATIRSLVNVAPTSLTALPGEPGQGNYAFADVQGAAVAFKNGNDRMYLNMNWRRSAGQVDNIARIHFTQGTIDRDATIDMPYNAATEQADGNLSGSFNQAWVVSYGQYVIVLNRSSTAYAAALPSGTGSVEDLISKNGYAPGSPVSVPAGQAAIFYLDPTAPSGLTAIRQTTGAVNLSWTNNAASGVTGFTIQRATNSTFTQNVTTATVSSTTTTYTDSTAPTTPNNYYYRVTATYSTGFTSADTSAIAAINTGAYISDTFTASNSTLLSAHTPDTNLPAGTYTAQGSSTYERDIQNDEAQLGADAGTALTTASTSTFTRSPILTVSGTINLGTDTGIAGAGTRGAGLGFYNGTFDTTHGYDHFTGLALNLNGTLSVILNGAYDNISVAYPAALGTFSTTANHTLAYTVNTLTGQLSAVTIDGTAVTLAVPAGTFTTALTAYLGIYNSSASASTHADFDKLTLTGIVPTIVTAPYSDPSPASTAATPPAGTLGVILADTFVAANGTTLVGRTPTTDLSGGTYQVQSGGFEENIESDQARLGANNGIASSLASNGTYVKPTQFTISATINPANNTSTGTNRGEGLGFYDAFSTLQAYTNFSGLDLTSTGSLELYVNGDDTGISAAYPGTYVAAANHTLSYTVNTSSGLISNVTIDGTVVTIASPANTFTDGITSYAGFLDSSATAGQYADFSNFQVTGVTPTTIAASNPNAITTTTANLHVLGAELDGESNLTYTWSTLLQPGFAAAPTFSVNGTNAAKNTTVTFSAAGSYTFGVTATNTTGFSTSQTVNVIVSSVPTTLIAGYPAVRVADGQCLSFVASAYDQFGNPIALTPNVTWKLASSSIGSITPVSGIYTAPASGTGTDMVTASYGGATTNVTFPVTVVTSLSAPQVATGAAASPSTMPLASTTTLSVLGSDDGGASGLTYTWSATGPGTVGYSVNGTNAASTTVASFSAAGSYVITATITDAGGLTTTATVPVTVVAPPAVQSIVINAGAAQRSMVTSATVTFNHAVTLAAGAINIGLHTSSTNGTTAGTLPTLFWSSPDGGTTWNVTFSGNGVVAGSIANGMYNLTVNAADVVDANALSLTASTTASFYRLFGDSNGDSVVDSIDALAFRRALGSTAYVAYFDYDGNGTIDSIDALRFRQDLGLSYSL